MPCKVPTDYRAQESSLYCEPDPFSWVKTKNDRRSITPVNKAHTHAHTHTHQVSWHSCPAPAAPSHCCRTKPALRPPAAPVCFKPHPTSCTSDDLICLFYLNDIESTHNVSCSAKLSSHESRLDCWFKAQNQVVWPDNLAIPPNKKANHEIFTTACWLHVWTSTNLIFESHALLLPRKNTLVLRLIGWDRCG